MSGRWFPGEQEAGVGRVRTPSRRARVWLAWIATVVVVGGTAFVAGRWTFTPPPVAMAERPAAEYTVVEETVGESLDVTVQVTWRQQYSGVNPAAGTVTSVSAQGLAHVDEGDVLYSVNLRPVVAAQGPVPSFRDLARGSVGPDVTQLQEFLASGGYITSTPGGHFGSATVSAVKAWQRGMGVEPTGVVLAGDLLFVTELPAHVILDEALYPGAQVTPGQQLVSVVESEPTFAARINPEQIPRLPETGSDVSIAGPSSVWQANTGRLEIDESGAATLTLTPAEGDSICGNECETLDYSPQGLALSGQIVVTPETSGPTVPLSALGTAANGDVFVIDETGERAVVDVKVRDGSRAVVSGVDVGDVIRLFAVVDQGSSTEVDNGSGQS